LKWYCPKRAESEIVRRYAIAEPRGAVTDGRLQCRSATLDPVSPILREREIAVSSIGGTKWASRLAVWQKAALTRPPEPTDTAAEGLGERAVSVENLERNI